VLCCLEGHSFEETVRQLGWPRGTVATRLARGKERLRARLAQRGLALSAALLSHLLAQSLASAALPISLLRATARAAVSFALGQLAAAPAAAELAGEVLQGMVTRKLVFAVLLFLALTMAAGAAFLMIQPAEKGASPDPGLARGPDHGSGGKLNKKQPPKPAPGQAVNGLKLTLSPARAETLLNQKGTNIEPVWLQLAFANVGRRPIKVETWGLFVKKLTFEVTGPDAHSVRRRQLEGMFGGAAQPTYWPTLRPGQSWDEGGSFQLPDLGKGTAAIALVKPGVYRIKVTYTHAAEEPSEFRAGSWTGALTSNEIRLTVLQAPGAPPSQGPVVEIQKLLGTVYRDGQNPARPVIAVSLRGTDARDADLKHLRDLTDLKILHLGQTELTDSGLAHLKGLTNLEQLSLDRTKITDTGLARLKGLTRLQQLNLAATGVTDTGLAHLHKLAGLQTLDLFSTRVTTAGVQKLQKALPRLNIRYFPGIN
jgi:hypothetical protein